MIIVKKAFISFCLLFSLCPLFAQNEDSVEQKKFFRGIEGGVVFNTGYIFENFPEIGYSGGGVPLGVGGRGLVILGDHLRVGGEGYMNTMGLDKKGSESIYAFGGAMADFCWKFGPVLAYIGSNIGGGILKNFVSTQQPSHSWEEVGAYYNKQFVWSAHPYTGVQIRLTNKIALIIQVSYTLPLNGNICKEFNGLNTSIGLQFGNY